jgi:hypothetical protein
VLGRDGMGFLLDGRGRRGGASQGLPERGCGTPRSSALAWARRRRSSAPAGRTHLIAAGANTDDVAAIAGHSINVPAEHYRQALHRSSEFIKAAIG